MYKMKIDSHQHYWHYNSTDYGWMGEEMGAIRRDFLPADFLPELKSIAFDGSIAVQARQSAEETRWLLELADQYPHILGVVGWVDLRAEDVRQQLSDFAAHPRAVGVRHVIHDEPDVDFMLQPAFVRGVQQLVDFGLAYDLLLFQKHLPNALKLVQSCSSQQIFVLDHIGKPVFNGVAYLKWREGIRQLALNQNVYCKLSGMVTEVDWQHWEASDFEVYLQLLLDKFGADRLMIGSDWPVCLVAGSYSKVMQVVQDFIAQLSPDEQSAILGGNAARAYGIKV